MDIIRIIGIGLITALLSLFIKQQRPELAVMLPMLGAAAILFVIAPYLKEILSMFETIAEEAGLKSLYLHLVIKIIGVAYLCQFASELCKDAGEGSMASKIELAGKVMILTLSMPVIYQLLDLVGSIIRF